MLQLVVTKALPAVLPSVKTLMARPNFDLHVKASTNAQDMGKELKLNSMRHEKLTKCMTAVTILALRFESFKYLTKAFNDFTFVTVNLQNYFSPWI